MDPNHLNKLLIFRPQVVLFEIEFQSVQWLQGKSFDIADSILDPNPHNDFIHRYNPDDSLGTTFGKRNSFVKCIILFKFLKCLETSLIVLLYNIQQKLK